MAYVFMAIYFFFLSLIELAKKIVKRLARKPAPANFPSSR